MSSKVLVTPLNWGLGHATRCIPVIEALLSKNAEVFLASDGGALRLLQREFPKLPALNLAPYNIRYPTHSMILNLGRQWPQLRKAIRREHVQVAELVKNLQIEAVISDCRFGCYHASVPSVFISHQIHLQSRYAVVRKWATAVHSGRMKKFDCCWVPDFPEPPGLAGKLAHPRPGPEFTYIGPLSRMSFISRKKKYDAVAVLSGPEPQRSILEKMILTQLGRLEGAFALVRGLPGKPTRLKTPENVVIFPFLQTAALQELLASTGVVICRSGYSTIMDLAKTGHKAIFIPTPGQTEQEYLAKKFFREGIFYCQPQKSLDLKTALREVRAYPGVRCEESGWLLENSINFLLDIIKY